MEEVEREMRFSHSILSLKPGRLRATKLWPARSGVLVGISRATCLNRHIEFVVLVSRPNYGSATQQIWLFLLLLLLLVRLQAKRAAAGKIRLRFIDFLRQSNCKRLAGWMLQVGRQPSRITFRVICIHCAAASDSSSIRKRV